MASNSSKSIPFLVMFIVVLSLSGELYFDTDIDLESYLPLLIPLGLGGAVIKSIKVASEMKKSLQIEKEILKKRKIVTDLKNEGGIQ